MNVTSLYRPLLALVLSAASVVLAGGWVFSQPLIKTPTQIEGPFYPDRLPPDTDNDLVRVNESKTLAKGTISHLFGKVTDIKGKPVGGAVVEIWQCDGGGVYLHSGSHDREKYDKNFQGFGRCTTTPDGSYYFRTLRPVPYTFRTPHIHFMVKKDGKPLLTTQIYVKGEPLNKKDGIYRALRDPKARDAITVDFTPMKGSKSELTARFDIVLGATPQIEDND
jgi:protocatechuate 3,4-dioxygenase beta subunit